MIPVLYEKNETNFAHNGIGRLSDAIKVIVTEERNGAFELEMDYPINGAFYKDIELNSIIKAQPNDFDDDQLFYVYSLTRYMSGFATYYCRHISYRLSGIPVKPFTASGIAAALSGLKSNAVADPGFNLYTDIESSATFKFSAPQTLKGLLGGVDGSILDTYGGEFKWDNFTVQLLEARGEDTGVTIRYGKNLTDLTDDENIETTFNGVFPYWYREGEGAVYPSSAAVSPNMDYPYPYYELADMTGDYDKQPTATQLSNKAKTAANHLEMPSPSINISFVALWKNKEYELLKALEKVKLCDTVTVYHEGMGIAFRNKVIKTVYNVLNEQYEEVTIGAERSDLYETLSNINDEMSDSATQGNLCGLIATRSITLETGVSIAANTIRTATPTTNIDVDGYYVLDIVRMRSHNNGNVSFSTASINRGSTTTVTYTCRNNSSSAQSNITIRAIILYVKAKYAVAL